MNQLAAEAAASFEGGADDLRSFVQECSDADWDALVPIEGRTVRVMAFHCARGTRLVREWLEPMRHGLAVPGEAGEIDAYNASEMDQHAGATREEVLDILNRDVPGNAAFLRSLTDAEMQVRAPFGPGGGQEMGLAQVARVGGRHFEVHLAHIREALAAR
ncbi:MAG TPA: DinB family protein [Candidatus Dormibacteraeota bacterium]|nr:DinB family protein [Candidatus Dormibacteraeota bacterium]